MGLLDGLLGGAVGAEMVAVVNKLIEQHGGVPGIVAHLEEQGLGSAVRSWVGSGQNLPISAHQVQQAFGAEALGSLAGRLGLSPQNLAQRLSEALPQAIDRLTPGGRLPAAS